MLCRLRYALGHRYAIHRSIKHFSSTSNLSKRVTQGTADQLFEPVQKKVSKHNVPVIVEPIPLEPKQTTSGSVVLDTVRELTKKHSQCVLLVQVGDFYELYEKHATKYAPLLDLKLTRKKVANGQVVDFAGFPSRALDRYVDILVNRLGCRVALCEQLGNLLRQDGSVLGMERDITRIITPGTVIEERYLNAHAYNYLLAVFPVTDLTTETAPIGLAWVDLSVGEIKLQQSTLQAFKDDITRIGPREVILPQWMEPTIDNKHDQLLDGMDQDLFDPVTRILATNPSLFITYQPETNFDGALCRSTLTSMAANDGGTVALDIFSDQSLAAGMALLHYIDQTHVGRKPRLLQPSPFIVKDTLRIDSAAMTSLELLKGLKDGRRQNSLLGILDHTTTSAGSRLLSQWLSCPLGSQQAIQHRLNIVDYFYQDPYTMDQVRDLLKQSTDAQRTLQRLAMRRGQYSDLYEINHTLNIMKSIRHMFRHDTSLPAPVESLLADLDPHDTLIDDIQAAFVDQNLTDNEAIIGDDDNTDSPADRQIGYVNPNYSRKLKRLYNNLKQLEENKGLLQDELRSICGRSLSLISQAPYRHVVEVNAAPSKKLESHYHQQGTLTLIHQTKSKRRYHLSSWTDISIKLDDTIAQIRDIEAQVFEQLVGRLLAHSHSIIKSCDTLAQLDILTTFACLAKQHDWTRPGINNAQDTTIVGGRHPVVESHLAKKGRLFTRNNCELKKDHRLWLLTGPNMGGKSTFLRQNAIITVMAHMGSFVPARQADIGLTDWIFSRVGAADNLAQDQSTFMVEMTETATILQHATPKSLVIMDEVGRGTSTADGFALAYAILDDLSRRVGCRTLFATHYHELADAVGSFGNLQCFKTDIHEDQFGFSFLHRVEPGVCRQSHGLKVAQVAGLPSPVINVARSVWLSLNNGSSLWADKLQNIQKDMESE
ncbi:muts domain V-domain-containing protein [Chlamydoabsidia padenii]|nr:muts domain V-domain-containing protein [Chlamydoabsidia padenii]